MDREISRARDSDPQDGAGFTCAESEGFQTAWPAPGRTALVQPGTVTAQGAVPQVLHVLHEGPHHLHLGLASGAGLQRK